MMDADSAGKQKYQHCRKAGICGLRLCSSMQRETSARSGIYDPVGGRIERQLGDKSPFH